ncbi:hypothetical protein AZZ62_005159, partial [Klebsiella variicola]
MFFPERRPTTRFTESRKSCTSLSTVLLGLVAMCFPYRVNKLFSDIRKYHCANRA